MFAVDQHMTETQLLELQKAIEKEIERAQEALAAAKDWPHYYEILWFMSRLRAKNLVVAWYRNAELCIPFLCGPYEEKMLDATAIICFEDIDEKVSLASAMDLIATEFSLTPAIVPSPTEVGAGDARGR